MILPLGPSWRSSKSIPKRCRTTATSASHFLEDVPSEIDISEDPKVSLATSTSPFSEDVSSETFIFLSLSRPLSPWHPRWKVNVEIIRCGVNVEIPRSDCPSVLYHGEGSMLKVNVELTCKSSTWRFSTLDG